MNDLARLSAAERQQMIDEFVDATFAGTDPDAPGAGIANNMRTLPTELPDEPTTEQVEAWVELAELVKDPAFRARTREMAVAGSEAPGDQPQFDPAPIVEHAGAAVAAGIAPGSPAGQAVLARIIEPGMDAAARDQLADTIDTFTDRRVSRYWDLLGILNGWGRGPSQIEPFEWFIDALRAHGAGH